MARGIRAGRSILWPPSSLQRQGIIYAWRLLGVRAGWDPLWPLKNMGSRGIPASGQLKGQHTYTHTHPHHARTTHAFTHPSIPSVGMCVGVCMWVCMDGGRYIGWPYQEIIEIGPSYIPSPSPCHKNPRDFLGIFMGIDGCECKEP